MLNRLLSHFFWILFILCSLFLAELQGLSQPVWAKTNTFKDNHLEAYNATPLNHRMPLVLIHGIAPEKGDYYNWATYLEAIQGNQAFNQRYKIYFFHFDPKKNVDETADVLIQSLIHLKQKKRVRKIRVIALSQGGLIFRRAYNHPKIQQLTEQAITLGTPFHGTPLANKSWMKERMKRGSIFSPMRHTLGITYHFVHKKSPHFESDYCWDNLDHGLAPEVNRGLPLKCHATDLATQYKNAPFITYASFFDVNRKKRAYILKQLDLDIQLPKERSAFFLSRARVFNLTQNKIEKMPLSNALNPLKPKFTPLMVYNDGVMPVSSALWLGRFYNPHVSTHSQIQLWDALKNLQGTGTARLFPGIDHQNWMLDTTRTHSKKVLDLLNPNVPEKSVFDWLLYDLMKDNPPAKPH